MPIVGALVLAALHAVHASGADDARAPVLADRIDAEVDGHSSYVAFSPSQDLGIVVLSNLGGRTAEALGNWLERELHAWRGARAAAPSEPAAGAP